MPHLTSWLRYVGPNSSPPWNGLGHYDKDGIDNIGLILNIFTTYELTVLLEKKYEEGKEEEKKTIANTPKFTFDIEKLRNGEYIKILLDQSLAISLLAYLDRYYTLDYHPYELWVPREGIQLWYNRNILKLQDFIHTRVKTSTFTPFQSVFTGALLSKLIYHVTIWNHDWQSFLVLYQRISKSLKKDIDSAVSKDQMLIRSIRKEWNIDSVTSKTLRNGFNKALINKITTYIQSHYTYCNYCYKPIYCDFSVFTSELDMVTNKHYKVSGSCRTAIYQSYLKRSHHNEDLICQLVRTRHEKINLLTNKVDTKKEDRGHHYLKHNKIKQLILGNKIRRLIKSESDSESEAETRKKRKIVNESDLD